ncbi:uncharacterized protein TNCV_4142231 [Trichonephila clavipes]|nr:uncharacterized protein TNCV_4142231 [Trichonephila clavipes]
MSSLSIDHRAAVKGSDHGTHVMNFSKFFRSSLRDAEIILRAGQRIISEINILVENSQGSSQIPKSNPQLLNAEIKKKIARHENIKSMSFTRNGKIRFSTLDPVCAAQILS